MSAELSRDQAEQSVKHRVSLSRKISRMAAAVALASGIALGASDREPVPAEAAEIAVLVGSSIVSAGESVLVRRQCRQIVAEHNGKGFTSLVFKPYVKETSSEGKKTDFVNRVNNAVDWAEYSIGTVGFGLLPFLSGACASDLVDSIRTGEQFMPKDLLGAGEPGTGLSAFATATTLGYLAYKDYILNELETAHIDALDGPQVPPGLT